MSFLNLCFMKMVFYLIKNKKKIIGENETLHLFNKNDFSWVVSESEILNFDGL